MPISWRLCCDIQNCSSFDETQGKGFPLKRIIRESSIHFGFLILWKVHRRLIRQNHFFLWYLARTNLETVTVVQFEKQSHT